MVLVDNCKKSHVAKYFERSRPTIDDWIDRYEREGIAGLMDRPGRGRNSIVSDKMFKFVIRSKRITNAMKIRDEINNRTKKLLSLSTIRRKLKKFRYSRKIYIHRVITNRASDEEIKGFQKANVSWISRLDNDEEFLVLAQDEAHTSAYTKARGHWWSEINTKIYTTAPVKTERITIFGVIGSNGENHYKIAKTANSETFIEFLKELKKKYNEKIVLLVDGASYHRSKVTKKYAEEHDIILVNLPTAVPELNASEEIWNQFRKGVSPDLIFRTTKALKKYTLNALKNLNLKINVVSYLKRNIITPKSF